MLIVDQLDTTHPLSDCQWGFRAGRSTVGALLATTVEPLNKGHLRTEGIVPYSEVVPYWEVFQKKLSAVLCSSGSTIQHQAVGIRAIQIIIALKKIPID